MKLFHSLLRIKSHIKHKQNSNSSSDIDAISVLSILSSEILLHILSFLTQSDLCTVARVCKEFTMLSYDRTLWRAFVVHSNFTKRHIKKTLNVLSASGRLQNVKRLSVRSKNITEDSLEALLRNTPNLKDIRLYNLSVSEKATQNLVNHCPNLEIIHLHGGKANDKCLELLSTGFKNLRHIDLQHVENVTTRGLIHILARRNLSCMNFREMHGSELLALAPHCTNFVTMDLSYSQVQDSEFKEFLQYCHKLKNISLASCPTITDVTLEHLVEYLPNMTELNISNCPNITAYGVNLILRRATNLVTLNLSKLKCLHPLDFSRRRFDFSSANTYTQSSKLQNLDLSATNVTDDDVVNLFGQFESLKKISLKDCSNLKSFTMTVMERIA